MLRANMLQCTLLSVTPLQKSHTDTFLHNLRIEVSMCLYDCMALKEEKNTFNASCNGMYNFLCSFSIAQEDFPTNNWQPVRADGVKILPSQYILMTTREHLYTIYDIKGQSVRINP